MAKTTAILLLTLGLLLGLTSAVLINHVDEPIQRKIIKQFLDSPKKELFKVYHFLYEKSYALNSEEGLKRYRIFKESLKIVKEVNSQNLSYSLGINNFSDLTREEFKEKYLNGKKTKDLTQNAFISEETWSAGPNYQQSVDHTNYLPAPRHQESCGSCWAFATTSAIAANYNKLNYITDARQKFDLSPQDLINCYSDSDACNGYDPLFATKETVTRGVLFEADEVYESGFTKEKKTCKSTKRMNMVKNVEFCRDCTRDQFFALLQRGPVISGVDGEGNGNLQHYEKGIIESLPCSEENHSVVVVGYDGGENGAYNVLNSWGDQWGENGRFRIRRRSSDKSCFLENEADLPIVTKVNYILPPPPVPKCMQAYSQCYGKGSSLEVCSSKSDVSINLNAIRANKAKGKYLLYSEKNCGGAYFNPKINVSCFKDAGISGIKSIYIDDGVKPKRGCVFLYPDSCHGVTNSAKAIEVCSDIADLSSTLKQWGSEKVKSFKFGEGVISLGVYTDTNFYGSYSKYDKESKDIHETYKKSLKSIKVIK